MTAANWYKVNNESAVLTPAILVYPERIKENIRRMITTAGSVERLMPHMKTHKTKEILKLQLEQGIDKIKCATLVEAELAAEAGVKEVLIAYQLVGPAIQKLIDLVKSFPTTKFASVVDNENTLQHYDFMAAAYDLVLNLYIDIDDGMHRTGIAPGEKVVALVKTLESMDHLQMMGLHVYDGHMHISDPGKRESQCDADFEGVKKLIEALKSAELPVGRLVCGGTPSFPIHAKYPERILSPGTCLLWDNRYSSEYEDMEFLHAAVVMTRVISKPGKNRLCLDLGHKAIASEMSPPRIFFPEFPNYTPVVHSEEHLVIELDQSVDEISVGQALYGIPLHICPTMALHDQVQVVEDGKVTGDWKVAARGRLVLNQ